MLLACKTGGRQAKLRVTGKMWNGPMLSCQGLGWYARVIRLQLMLFASGMHTHRDCSPSQGSQEVPVHQLCASGVRPKPCVAQAL
jgi:hypothetical protein